MKLLDFIKRVEGDDSRPLGNGLFGSTYDVYGRVWNIGCGVTKGITKNTVMTQPQIDAAVEAELASAVADVDRLVKVKLTENQRVVLCSFVYNEGVGTFQKSSVLTYVNAGKLDQVPARLSLYCYAGGVKVSGLVNRRNQEIALWNTADDQPQLQTATVQPAIKETTMATTATTTTPAPTSNSDAFQALLAAAMADITAIKQKIAGVFAGLASGGASIALAAMLPDKTMALIIGGVGGLAGFLTIVIHLYTLFTGLSANNSSTILLFENGINTAQRFIGVTPTVWDNAAPAPTQAAA